MGASRIIATLLCLITIAPILHGSARSTPATDGGETRAADAPAQLIAEPGQADSAPLQTIRELYTSGLTVKAPRRLASLRLALRTHQLTYAKSDLPGHTAQLRLHAARRDRLTLGDLLQRDVVGAASFHTTTPPPTTPV
jgi:hypothetical protein